MKTSVGVFHKHADALEAVKILKQYNFPLKKVSILGKAIVEQNHLEKDDVQMINNVPVITGAIAGPVLGILSGIGIFAIPGFGFLYGAGAAIGFMAGLEVGIASGGIISLLMTMGFANDHAITYEKHMREGKYLIVVKGTIEEVNHAKQILHAEGMEMIHTHHPLKHAESSLSSGNSLFI